MDMATDPSPQGENPAYRLASSLRPEFQKRFEAVFDRLLTSGKQGAVRSLRTVISQGRVAINMSLPSFNSFVSDGEYLSIYEFVARDQGVTGPDLEQAVLERLNEFGPPRKKLDELFQFQSDTHYATFNLGGPGAEKYGLCCVVFDVLHWAPFHTCFAGDSIRTCFSSNRVQVLEDAEILQRFAIGDDLVRLAILQQEELLEEHEHAVNRFMVSSIFEKDDNFLEIHLHGPVLRDHIQEVRLRQEEFTSLRLRSREIYRHSGPVSWKFDNVEPFGRMLDLLDYYEIPLVLV